MGARPREADVLDLLLRDALQRDVCAAPVAARIWAKLCARIEAERSEFHVQPAIKTSSNRRPCAWALDWNLYVSGASALRLR